MSKSHKRRLNRFWSAFDQDTLAAICAAPEDAFPGAYGLSKVPCGRNLWSDTEDFYAYRDNGSQVLAVAHLDTVQPAHKRAAHFVETSDGPVVFSGALDDRLGAYLILDMLPKLGIQTDVLLTTGEESGNSTAQYFEAGKDYNWVIEFDRGGTDVVMYQYDDAETRNLVRASGARVGDGIFSDIAYLDFLECKAFNWGVGYRDYHSPRSHAFLADTAAMVSHFLRFHKANADEYLPHDSRDTSKWWKSYGYYADEPAADIVDAEIVGEDAEFLNELDADKVADWPTNEEVTRMLERLDSEMGL